MHSRLSDLPMRPLANKSQDGVYKEFYNNSTTPRVNTDEIIVEAIRKQYPGLHLTVIPTYSVSLLNFASTGHAQVTPVDADNSLTENLKWRMYAAPARRLDGGSGFLYDSIQFGKFIYKWSDQEYLLYSVVGTDGPYKSAMTYLLGSPESNDRLMLEVGRWENEIHNSVLVFDGGYWQKSYELWQAVQQAHWDDVILDKDIKKSVIGEITKFFDSRERYQKLKVPWKRGLIFHGPPGNGKTISIKAMMHSLYDRPDPTPTLYVRSLSSYGGPEYALNQIFSKARQMAPCFLVFEDLDSIVTDSVRSYFLNEVDGLRDNDGILMVGSTNHFDRLDPGISKRPSRFDRKYLFPDPNMEQRVQYCEFWRNKLRENKDIEFPERLNKAIASVTKGFSFAYIQEAFVAALLAIANGDANEHDCETKQEMTCGCEDPTDMNDVLRRSVADDKDLEQYVLWREMKKVIKTLREELGTENRVDYACWKNYGGKFDD